jgi:hypothetical protein
LPEADVIANRRKSAVTAVAPEAIIVPFSDSVVISVTVFQDSWNTFHWPMAAIASVSTLVSPRTNVMLPSAADTLKPAPMAPVPVVARAPNWADWLVAFGTTRIRIEQNTVSSPAGRPSQRPSAPKNAARFVDAAAAERMLTE